MPRNVSGPRLKLKLLRSLWGVVIQESQALDPLLAAGGGGGGAAVPVRSKFIPSTLDHKLFPSRQVRLRLIDRSNFRER